ncbi:MAG: MBL fold metallo-hydrolase [Bradymonadales bacterium]|nr:MBL fold metallo-hydrolase [Bradymonadales bacterium]
MNPLKNRSWTLLLLLAVLTFGIGCGSSSPIVREEVTPVPIPIEQAAERLQVHFIDVGQGDAIVIITPSGRVVLIDAGPPDSASALVAAMRQLGIWQINLAIITHAHADHIGGFQAILDAFPVIRFGDPGYLHPSAMYASLLERILDSELPIYELRQGQWIQLEDEIRAVVVSPAQDLFSGTRSDANANSIVLLLTYREVSFLFMGDAEAETETLVANCGLVDQVDVLKVSHHGGRHSSIPQFLAVARPRMAVILCGTGNSYGHPSPETLERLDPYAINGIYRTDLHGTVSVTTDGSQIDVVTERSIPQEQAQVAF